jgi:hypothetical protein
MHVLRQHSYQAGLFALLSGADLVLTCHLLHLGGGEVYEANWLAGWVLARYGVAGLAAFKGAVVLVVGLLAGVVALSRPRAARGLTTFGCAAVGGVVLYSVVLWARLDQQPGPSSHQDLALARQKGLELDEYARERAAFSAFIEQESRALAAGRRTLRKVVTILATSAAARDPRIMEGYRNGLESKSDAECLALMALMCACEFLETDGSTAAQRRARDLLAAYQADHGLLPPAPLGSPLAFLNLPLADDASPVPVRCRGHRKGRETVWQ